MSNKHSPDISVHSQNGNTPDENNEDIDNTKANNISLENIDSETINKLRGDAIGDTLYSQSSVIRILLQLSDVEWNDKLEEDLCFLWDTTVERDVCEYLYQLSFTSIATAIILKYNEPRLIEIIIGILGNICSNSDISPDITDVEINIVLNALETDDHLILIQIMRFLMAVVYHRKGKLHFVTSEVMEKICFILTNSTNRELILCTMDALAKITEDFKIESELLNIDVFNSLLITYDFINTQKSDKEDDFEEETEEERKCLNSFVHVILNLCLYLNEATQVDIHRETSARNKDLVTRFKIIMKKFSKEKNLIPLSEDIIFYFESFTIIFPVLNIKYNKDMFVSLFEIVKLLWKNGEDKIENFIELIRYLISAVDINNFVRDCANLNCDTSIFKLILDHNSKCDYNYKENILSVIDKSNKTSK